MKKILKWFLFAAIALVLIVTSILAIAYWNRDALLQNLSATLNKDINGKLHIQKIDFTFLHHFPNFSVSLSDVYLHGALYDSFPVNIFSAKKIFIDIKVLPLLAKEIQMKSISVDDAEAFIFKTSHGDTNADILKPSADSLTHKSATQETPLLFTLKNIDFRSVNVTFADSLKNKYMHFKFLETNHILTQSDSLYTMSVHGPVHFNGLVFNVASGGFLTDKDAFADLHLAYNPLAKSLTIYPSSLTIEESIIDLTGIIELPQGGNYILTFHSGNLSLAKAQEFLNQRLNHTLQKFFIETPVTTTVSLAGRSIPGFIPNIDVQFETKNATFKYGSLDFSDLTVSGSFTNHIDSTKINDNDNSRVTIESFSGRMEKLPIQGKVSFTALKDPVMDLDVSTALSYQDVNEEMDTTRFVIKSGAFTSAVTYSGKLTEYLDSTRTVYHGKLKGSCKAVDASLLYKPKKLLLNKISAACEFDEKKFTINDLAVRFNGNTIHMKGFMQNFIPFFIRPQTKGYVRLSINANDLDITALATESNIEKKTSGEKSRSRKKMTDLFDVVYNTLEFDLDVRAKRLSFRKFIADNFAGKVKLNDNMLEAGPISMQFAKGTMNLSFILSRVFEPISPMAVSATITDADIQQVFRSFNNFNQNTIHDENLLGSISATIKFNADLNERYGVIGSSMRGVLDCKIKNGGLINFEPMENMSNFLFKKRDFSNVQFAELSSNFSIEGAALDISRMEIQSSVLSLFLQGRYSFTDSTSLSVQLPLSNLKKRDKNFKLENIGTHAKTGPSVYLHIYRNKDINSKINIAYDPFKKWAKKQ